MATRRGALALSHGTHGCWQFGSVEERREIFSAFVIGGLTRSEAVMWIGHEGDEGLLSTLESRFDVDALLASSRLTLADVERAYPSRDFDIRRRVAGFARLADVATAGGFSGLRVFADNSGLPARVGADAWTRYEWEIGRMIAARPLVAVCGFSTSVVNGMELSALDAVHPVCVSPEARPSPFQIRLGRDGSVVLAGEIDSFSVDSARLLLRAAVEEAGRPVFELSQLRFSDAAGTSAVLEMALASAAALHGASPTFRKLCGLLGYRDMGRVFSD